MRSVCLLGASGSIGTQSLDVMFKNKEFFNLVSFSVGNNTKNISRIINKFPEVKNVYLIDNKKKKLFQNKHPKVTFYSSKDIELSEFLLLDNPEMVINALVGQVGLRPTISALENNKILALANKESLVIGGELINSILKEKKSKLIPIDSEHVSLAKCIDVDNKNVKKYFITASGGALRDYPLDKFENITVEEVLNHPNWKMGNKITVDSATMMNKAFEVIEAYHLFGIPYNKLKIFVNRDSLIHAGIIYKDGIRLDISKPDMRVPIKWALFEKQVPYKTVYAPSFDCLKEKVEELDERRYPLFKYARRTLKNMGTYGAALNAANEISVRYFLKGLIKFKDIERIIDKVMKNHVNIIKPSLSDLEKTTYEISEITRKECERRSIK